MGTVNNLTKQWFLTREFKFVYSGAEIPFSSLVDQPLLLQASPAAPR
jgi:hypothetical protein